MMHWLRKHEAQVRFISKQKSTALAVLFCLSRVDKKDAIINTSLITRLQLKTRCQIRKIVFFAICSAF